MKVKLVGKVCGVCGDKALGCNFNAITCESCKAFFRRNALLQKDFKCPFSEHCEITPVTRRFCQKCRLDKCFTIGMCKNLIMSEEDKQVKRQKILENRQRKKMGMAGFKKGFQKVRKVIAYSSDSKDSDVIPLQNLSPKNETSRDTNSSWTEEAEYAFSTNNNDAQIVSSSDDVPMIRSMLNNTPQDQNSEQNDNKVEICDSKSYSVYPDVNLKENEQNFDSTTISSSDDHLDEVTRDVVREVRSSPVELNSLETILCEAIKLEFQTFSFTQNTSKELNDTERAKLNELIVANKNLSIPLDEELKNSLLGQTRDPQGKLEAGPALLDVINLTAIAIRRLIKMAKKINAFKNMCQEDQVALLKGGATEIMILRSALNYDSKNNSWQIPRKRHSLNLKVDFLKLAKTNAYHEHEKFIRTFDPRWRSDENIILIMCAITLFTPGRQKLVHKDVIKLEQSSYYYLLRRYLECTYPGCEAKSTFLKLIQKISELHVLNEEIVNIYLDVNPSQVEPLLIEIFDMKH